MNYYKDIIDNSLIKNYIKINNLNNEMFAKICNVDTSTIENILNKRVGFKIGDIFKIANVLDCGYVEIFNIFKFLLDNPDIVLKK